MVLSARRICGSSSISRIEGSLTTIQLPWGFRQRAVHRQRQREMKGEAVRLIGSPDFPAVRFHQALAYRESQPGAGDFVRLGDAVKFVENPVEMLHRNRLALINHPGMQRVILHAGLDLDRRGWRGILDAVAQQVREYLLHHDVIRWNQWDVTRDIDQ